MSQFQTDMSQNETARPELRAMHRNRVLKGGTVYFNKGYASFQCKVRNMNEKGALLEFGETHGIPTEFEFKTSSDDVKIPAKMIWKSKSHVGISFS